MVSVIFCAHGIQYKIMQYTVYIVYTTLNISGVAIVRTIYHIAKKVLVVKLGKIGELC